MQANPYTTTEEKVPENIFYQALERGDMNIVHFMLLANLNNLGIVEPTLHCLNDHPSGKKLPIELFWRQLQVASDDPYHAKMIARKDEYITAFVSGGLNEDGIAFLRRQGVAEELLQDGLKAKKIAHEFLSIDDRNELLYDVDLLLDDQGKTLLQRTYDDRGNKALDRMIRNRLEWGSKRVRVVQQLQREFEKTYQRPSEEKAKTLFYQALEKRDLTVVLRMLNTYFINSDDNIIPMSYINEGPQMPIKLFLEIPDEAFEDPALSEELKGTKRKYIRSFCLQGLNSAGKNLLKEHDFQTYCDADTLSHSYLSETPTNYPNVARQMEEYEEQPSYFYGYDLEDLKEFVIFGILGVFAATLTDKCIKYFFYKCKGGNPSLEEEKLEESIHNITTTRAS